MSRVGELKSTLSTSVNQWELDSQFSADQALHESWFIKLVKMRVYEFLVLVHRCVPVVILSQCGSAGLRNKDSWGRCYRFLGLQNNFRPLRQRSGIWSLILVGNRFPLKFLSRFFSFHMSTTVALQNIVCFISCVMLCPWFRRIFLLKNL